LIYKFHPEARFELESAVEYYETQQAKVGLEFLEEVYSSIYRIVEHPEAFPPISKNARRCLTNRFPFAIIFQIRQNEILILAITHLAANLDTGKSEQIHNVLESGFKHPASCIRYHVYSIRHLTKSADYDFK
jgi:plasmid stabilization system protein ParE